LSEIYDLIGVGFGPANLTLGVCLEEAAEEGARERELRWLFLEAKPQAVWHPGLLLESTSIQNSVLKDLALVRNPRSRFTFLSYLQEKGRLFEFLNLRELYPSRIEFNDYLCWAADQLRGHVRYGRPVLAVEPVAGEGGTVELLRVIAAAGDGAEELLARNLVIATGGAPWVPAGVELAPRGRAFHAHEFLPRLARDYPDAGAPYRFVVVGQGQSAAELFYHLLTRYPQADVTAAIRRFAYKPVDVSHFTNEIFFPQMVDVVYDLPEDKRRLLLDMCADVNYGVVDTDLIRRIYRALYQEKVAGRERARILPFLHLTGVEEGPAAVTARFVDLLRDRPVAMESDALVLATGFEWHREHPLLAAVSPYLDRASGGGYRPGRDYRLAARPGFAPGIYVQGGAEATHGVSETVLSLMPMRAADIVRSLFGRTVVADARPESGLEAKDRRI
jgi:L-ornithine N5-monooxygenase